MTLGVVARSGTAGVASLPMYDLDELRWATDALWCFIAAQLQHAGIAAPDRLTRGRDLSGVWTDPALLLGQTCGYPLVTTLKDRVVLLAVPCYSALGCVGPHYRSTVIVRATEPAKALAEMRGRICAVNSEDSNSGMNLLRAAVAPLAGDGAPFFENVVFTGAHAASVLAVASGHADVAAIDCVTWAHLQRVRSAQTGYLRVLCWSNSYHGLPLITSIGTDAATREALLNALELVMQSAALRPARAALLLTGFSIVPLSVYDTLLAVEKNARRLGYPRLR